MAHVEQLWPVSLAAVILLGCGDGNGRVYAAAATGLAATIGATAMYRAQTGNCWANCTPGYACDRSRGLCYRTECVPGCTINQTCVIESNDSFRCVDDFGAVQIGTPPPMPASSSTPLPIAAPPVGSASPN